MKALPSIDGARRPRKRFSPWTAMPSIVSSLLSASSPLPKKAPAVRDARQQVRQPVSRFDRFVHVAAGQDIARFIDGPSLLVDANAREDESGQAEFALLARAAMRTHDVKIGRGIGHALAVELFEVLGDPWARDGSRPRAHRFRVWGFADQANFLAGVDGPILDGGELSGLGFVVHGQAAIGRSLRAGDAGDAAQIRRAFPVERGFDLVVRHVALAYGRLRACGDDSGTGNQEHRPPTEHDHESCSVLLWV